MCVHILQVSGREIDDSRDIKNIIHIEQGHAVESSVAARVRF